LTDGKTTKPNKTTNMKIQRVPSLILTTALVSGASLLHASQTVMVGGAEIDPTKDVIANNVNSDNTLLAQKPSDSIAVAIASFFARGGCQLRRSAYVNSKIAMIQNIEDFSGRSGTNAEQFKA